MTDATPASKQLINLFHEDQDFDTRSNNATMDKLFLYAIRDIDADTISDPFFCQNRIQAKRMFHQYVCGLPQSCDPFGFQLIILGIYSKTEHVIGSILEHPLGLNITICNGAEILKQWPPRKGVANPTPDLKGL